jgi:two-component system response regulator HydG
MQARLIVASNLVLENEVSAGRFRADLYFRLNVLGFHLPPLRERREVIPRLVAKYMAEFHGYHRGRLQGVADPALAALVEYHWPGNVRELRNVVERAVAVCPGSRIELTDLPPAIQSCVSPEPAEAAPTDLTRNELAIARRLAERQRIAEVLARTNNNRSHAAAELRISRVTLYKKLRLHGMS